MAVKYIVLHKEFVSFFDHSNFTSRDHVMIFVFQKATLRIILMIMTILKIKHLLSTRNYVHIQKHFTLH